MRAGGSSAALLVGLAAAACQDAPPPVSYPYDSVLVQRLVAPNLAWPSACGRAPSERIGLPVGLAREKTSRPVSAEFAAELADVIDALPRPFARLFERRVCAVVLMHGSPMSGTLAALASDSSRGLIFLDVDALNRTANAWMGFKESTPFMLGEQRSIRGKLADPADDSRRLLLEFVLVHELAHVADHTSPRDPAILKFEDQSWPRRDALAEAPFAHYPERHGRAPLPDALVEPYFELIATGAFASPATVANAGEDFADSVATYMHTVMRGRPWQLSLYDAGQLVMQLNTCWEEPRCHEKRALIEELLVRWSRE
jgi:hypothetical protein